MNEVTVTLTEEQKRQERECVQKIRDAVGASYTIIAQSLISVKEQKLWGEYPSMNLWALENLGFGQREVDNYIEGYRTTKLLRESDPNANPRLTHAKNLAKFEEDSRSAVWEKARELSDGGRMTNNDIIEAGESLLKDGTARLREGVKRLRSNGQSGFLENAKRAWFDLDEDQKIVLFTHWLKFEEESFLAVMKSYLEKQQEDNDNKQ